MERRDLLYSLTAFGLGLPQLHQTRFPFGSSRDSLFSAASGDLARARPTPQQRAWQDLEFGMFVHFAPNTW